MPPEEEPQDPGIESWVRERTNRAAWFAARMVNSAFPNLSADQLTNIGGGIYIAGVAHSVITHLDPKSSWTDHLLPFGEKVIGGLIDGIDGKFAKIKDTYGNGMNKDGGTDRWEYLASGVGRLIDARSRGSRYGQIAAVAATIAGQLPSVAKAFIGDEYGIEPNEGGNTKVDIVGTHAGRMPLVTFAQDFPKIAGVPVQEIVDTMVTIASLRVAKQRLDYINNPVPGPNDKVLDKDERQKAASRYELYSRLLGVSIAGMVGTYALLNTPQIHEWMRRKIQNILKVPIVK